MSSKPKVSMKLNEFDDNFMKFDLEIDKTNSIKMHHYDWDNINNDGSQTEQRDPSRSGRAEGRYDFIGYKLFVETGRDNWSTNLADINAIRNNLIKKKI